MMRRARRWLAAPAVLALLVLGAACAPVASPPPPPAPIPAPTPAPSSCSTPTQSASQEVSGSQGDAVAYAAVVDDGQGGPDVETFVAASQAEVDAHVDALASEGEVVAVAPDLPVQALAVTPGDDPQYPDQYGLTHAKFDQAWAQSGAHAPFDGSGQVIAVVDTGIDTDHPEFSGRVLGGHRFIGGDAGTNVEDDHGHGTHVAGIAAEGDNTAYGLGGAPVAKILPVKVLNNNGSGSSSDVADGITWAADNGATVVNLSLGGGSDSLIEPAVDYALSLGIEVVAAAGNNNSSTLTPPASLAGVVTVGATDSNDQKATFSSYGPDVEIAAPGVSILSTFPTPALTSPCRPDAFGSLSGTSMSTPFVAAAVALIQQKCGDLAPATTTSILQANAGPLVPGLGGASLLDVDKALLNAC
jgi:serine protease